MSPPTRPGAAGAAGAAGPAGPAVLAIGGSDPSCGAGIQSDIRTLEWFGVMPLTVITSITVQDGARVNRVEPLEPGLVLDQLDTLLAASTPAVIKCGMLATPPIVESIAARIERLHTERFPDDGTAHPPPLVVDPVAQAGGGETLGGRDVLQAIARSLLPLAEVVTCNAIEAGLLVDGTVETPEHGEAAARHIRQLGPRAVVVKGGHFTGEPVDILVDASGCHRFEGERIAGPSMHGTGCAFASAVAAGLAQGRSMQFAVADARAHVRALIADADRRDGARVLRRPPNLSR